MKIYRPSRDMTFKEFLYDQLSYRDDLYISRGTVYMRKKFFPDVPIGTVSDNKPNFNSETPTSYRLIIDEIERFEQKYGLEVGVVLPMVLK